MVNIVNTWWKFSWGLVIVQNNFGSQNIQIKHISWFKDA